MIKAEVVEYPGPGAEVPNWLTKCKDVLTSAPSLGVLALAIIAVLGVVVWHGNRPALTSSGSVQSQPAGSSSLKVVPATAAPLTAQPSDVSPPVPASSVPSSTGTPTPATVGPAPTISLNSLQSAGPTQNVVPSLTQAAAQTVQSAGNATLDTLQNLGL